MEKTEETATSIELKKEIINETVQNQVKNMKIEIMEGYKTIIEQLKQTGHGVYTFTSFSRAHIAEDLFMITGFSKSSIHLDDYDYNKLCIDIRKEKEYIHAISNIDLYVELYNQIIQDLGLTLK